MNLQFQSDGDLNPQNTDTHHPGAFENDANAAAISRLRSCRVNQPTHAPRALQEEEVQKQQRQLQEDRQEWQRKKEEYQKDLERLRDAQRKLERDREAVQRQFDKMGDVGLSEVSVGRVLTSCRHSVNHCRNIHLRNDDDAVFFIHPVFPCRRLPPPPRQMKRSSPAAPSVWSWTRWSSPPPLPHPCLDCSPRALNPKGRASTLSPCPPPPPV